jgi:hypothetical protein
MNSVSSLLHDLETIGATVRPAGGHLVLRAGHKPVPGELVRRIRQLKLDLLEYLGEQSVVQWLDRHPSPSPSGRCAFCGGFETGGAVVLPFGTEPGSHTWLHAGCWQPWHLQRRSAAQAAMANVPHREMR